MAFEKFFLFDKKLTKKQITKHYLKKSGKETKTKLIF